MFSLFNKNSIAILFRLGCYGTHNVFAIVVVHLKYNLFAVDLNSLICTLVAFAASDGKLSTFSQCARRDTEDERCLLLILATTAVLNTDHSSQRDGLICACDIASTFFPTNEMDRATKCTPNAHCCGESTIYSY